MKKRVIITGLLIAAIFVISVVLYFISLPKVSVIIPVYNGEKYIPSSELHVLGQNFKDFEVIYINDGSTDKTLEKLKELQTRYKNIRIYSQENQGAGMARNKGLSLARGKYVMFLDIDDIFNKNLLNIMYKKAVKTNSDIVICHAITVENGKIWSYDMSLPFGHPVDKEVFNRNDIKARILNFTGSEIWDKMFRRKFLIKNRILFPKLAHTEDVAFTPLALLLADRISTVNDFLVTYYPRLTPDSLSSKMNDSPCDTMDSLILLKNEFEKRNLYEEAEQSYLRLFIAVYVHLFNYIDENNKKMIRKKYEWFLKEIKVRDKKREYIDDNYLFDHFYEIERKYPV